MFFRFRSRPSKPQPHTSSLPLAAGGQVEQADDVEVVAAVLERAGMGVPAALALSIGKPLAWVGGQLLWMLQPFVDGFGVARRGPLSVPGLAALLEREGGVEALVERLDAGSHKEGGRG